LETVKAKETTTGTATAGTATAGTATAGTATTPNTTPPAPKQESSSTAANPERKEPKV
jgi:hypothetical protein